MIFEHLVIKVEGQYMFEILYVDDIVEGLRYKGEHYVIV